jgi:hypothetical protein
MRIVVYEISMDEYRFCSIFGIIDAILTSNDRSRRPVSLRKSGSVVQLEPGLQP